MKANAPRSFWKYCLSGFPLLIVLIFIAILITLAIIDGGSRFATWFFVLTGLVALGAGFRDWKKNG